MKTRLMILVAVVFVLNTAAKAQTDSLKNKRDRIIYTTFYNSVPDNFNFPLVGFVNVARGNHKGLQMGFSNMTFDDFKGIQMGFINTIFKKSSGVMLGFINTTLNNAGGLQSGFINTTQGNFSGAMFGFINTTLKNAKGFQSGFLNTVHGTCSGTMLGFSNLAFSNAQGIHIGFLNIARKEMKGCQIGFVNVADTVSKGVPIGFLSIVKKGGYRAIETGVNELYPFNLSFKIGVPLFYTFIQGSYNTAYDKPFASGLGFGSLIPLGKKLYLNPEFVNMASIDIENTNNAVSFATHLRYCITPRLQVAAGVSATWLNYENGENRYDPPFFTLSNDNIDAHNRILGGARISVSYSFTDLISN
jgi:hypothetical protein